LNSARNECGKKLPDKGGPIPRKLQLLRFTAKVSAAEWDAAGKGGVAAEIGGGGGWLYRWSSMPVAISRQSNWRLQF